MTFLRTSDRNRECHMSNSICRQKNRVQSNVFLSYIRVKIVIFYIEIFDLICGLFFMNKTSEKIRKSTSHVKISV
jgi:hypothetical protein